MAGFAGKGFCYEWYLGRRLRLYSLNILIDHFIPLLSSINMFHVLRELSTVSAIDLSAIKRPAWFCSCCSLSSLYQPRKLEGASSRTTCLRCWSWSFGICSEGIDSGWLWFPCSRWHPLQHTRCWLLFDGNLLTTDTGRYNVGYRTPSHFNTGVQIFLQRRAYIVGEVLGNDMRWNSKLTTNLSCVIHHIEPSTSQWPGPQRLTNVLLEARIDVSTSLVTDVANQSSIFLVRNLAS